MDSMVSILISYMHSYDISAEIKKTQKKNWICSFWYSLVIAIRFTEWGGFNSRSILQKKEARADDDDDNHLLHEIASLVTHDLLRFVPTSTPCLMRIK